MLYTHKVHSLIRQTMLIALFHFSNIIETCAQFDPNKAYAHSLNQDSKECWIKAQVTAWSKTNHMLIVVSPCWQTKKECVNNAISNHIENNKTQFDQTHTYAHSFNPGLQKKSTKSVLIMRISKNKRTTYFENTNKCATTAHKPCQTKLKNRSYFIIF